MEADVYLRMAAIEDTHWWFVARRRILDRVLQTLSLPPQARILEIGCGTGGNLSLLQKYGTLYAVEPDERARELVAERRAIRPMPGRLPDQLPFSGMKFDLIAMLDVLEHIDDDAAALRSLIDQLNPGGRVLITVPAYPWLWSQHDVSHHHKRRYSRARLREFVEQCGFRVPYITHFNSILLPIAIARRLLQRTLQRDTTDDEAMPSRMTNALLMSAFSVERLVIPRVSLPFGLSLLVIAEV